MTIQARLQEALHAHQQGDLERARSGYVAILKHQPRHPQALHLLGVCTFQAGFPDEAIEHINHAIDEAPEVADFHNNLGEVYRFSARHNEAEQAYLRALEIAPDYADAHNNLAIILQVRGNIEKAIEHLKIAQKLEPGAPQTAANLANVLRLAGDSGGALESFKRAITLAPEFSEARLALCQMLIEEQHLSEALEFAEHGIALNSEDPAALCARACVALSMAQFSLLEQLIAATVSHSPQSAPVQLTLGRLLLQMGENQQALHWLEQAAKQTPGDSQLHSLLSEVYLQLNRLDLALDAIEKALELDPNTAELRIQCARVYRYQDRLDQAQQVLEAVMLEDPEQRSATLELAEVCLLAGNTMRARELLQQALDQDPDNAVIREHLASVLLSAGDTSASIDHLEEIISRDPERITSYRLLSQTKRFNTEDDAIIKQLDDQLQCRELSPPLAAIGHFALGKMLADCDRYQEAFSHFTQANELRRKQVHYDSRVHENFISEQIEAFNCARIARFSQLGNATRVPIIIAGMPRSGTTLVERILASHSQVKAGGEIDALTRMTPRPLGKAPIENFLSLALDALDPSTVQRLSQDYLARLSRDHLDAKHITDKTPHNFLHLGMAAILFPNVPIIHCYRHPMATCMSIYSMEMNLGNEFAYQLEDLAQYYAQYQRVIGHWQQLLPGRIFNLSYERLIAEFETVCRELLAFCELEWDPNCLEFHTSKGAVLTASDWQVRQPLYRGAVNAWRNYKSELEPLRQALEQHGVSLDLT